MSRFKEVFHYWSLILLLLTVAVRAYFSAVIGLGDDEAYYWEWSRSLQWSYFDHPPMVAWLIWVGTRVFGPTPLGVRLPALICSAVSGFLLFTLARRLWNRHVANLAVFIYLVTPIFAVGSLLMVPDAPLGCAWLLSCLLMEKILIQGRDEMKNWLALGVCLGVGLLSKYPIAVLALSGVLLALTEANWRKSLRSFRFLAAMGLFVFCIFPLVEWNSQHEWQSFQFQFSNRFHGTVPFRLSRTLEFLASQLAVAGPFFFFAFAATAIVAMKRWQDRHFRFVIVLSLPLFSVFAVQSAFSDFKPHWPAPAYSLLIIGLARWMQEWTRGFKIIVIGGQLAIVLPLIVLFHVGAIHPVVPDVVRFFVPQIKWEAKFDPTNDLYGWREVMNDAGQIVDEIAKKTGRRPFVSSERYQIVSQLAFARPEEPVFRVLQDVDNYSYTQAESLSLLVGKDTVFVSDGRFPRDPRQENRFAQCEMIKTTRAFRGVVLAHEFDLWYCTDFRGIYQLLHYNPSRGEHESRSPFRPDRGWLLTVF